MLINGGNYYKALDAAIVEINRLRLHFVGYPNTESMRQSIKLQLRSVEQKILETYSVPIGFDVAFEQDTVTIRPYLDGEGRT